MIGPAIIRRFPTPGATQADATHMELAKSFEPSAIENRWYDFWESHGYFAASPVAQNEGSPDSYCIQLPPPYRHKTGG